MDGATEMRRSTDLRDALAAERTFLAWIRTGLALMGFGFVVARFGLFVQQLQSAQHAPAAPCTGCRRGSALHSSAWGWSSISTACRRSCCKISPWSRHWRRRLENRSGHARPRNNHG